MTTADTTDAKSHNQKLSVAATDNNRQSYTDDQLEAGARAFGQIYFHNWENFSDTRDLPAIISAFRAAIKAMDGVA